MTCAARAGLPSASSCCTRAAFIFPGLRTKFSNRPIRWCIGLSMGFQSQKNSLVNMNESRFALKVGIFVALGIIVVAGLLLIFSKGLNLFTPTYELRLRAATVGGLKNRAGVLLNGVAIGNVIGTEVA